jgi:hypothetical protein
MIVSKETNSTGKQNKKLSDKFGQFVVVRMELFNQGRYLTPHAKWVYATLRSFTNNETDRTFPSYDKIEERSGLNRPAISRALQELEHFYWIEKQKNFGRSTNYILRKPILTHPDGRMLEDQTCPTKSEAAKWKEAVRAERNGREVQRRLSRGEPIETWLPRSSSTHAATSQETRANPS